MACLLIRNTKTKTGIKTGKLKTLINVKLFSAFEAMALINVNTAEKPSEASMSTIINK